jgi:hypothetical protein
MEAFMKTKIVLIHALVGFLLLLSSVSFSQEVKSQKKALDAFINATTKAAGEPVPGAEITVEQVPGPEIIRDKKDKGVVTTGEEMEIVGLGFEKKVCISNAQGEFSFTLPDELFNRLPGEFYLKFTIKPKDPAKFSVENNSVVVKAKKSDGPKFVFLVTFERISAKTNKGTFAVNSKAQT